MGLETYSHLLGPTFFGLSSRSTVGIHRLRTPTRRVANMSVNRAN
jgi:hypothetical protein